MFLKGGQTRKHFLAMFPQDGQENIVSQPCFLKVDKPENIF